MTTTSATSCCAGRPAHARDHGYACLRPGPAGRSLPRRAATLAPPFIAVRAHANISVSALVAVLVHASLKLGSIGADLTWLAFAMTNIANASGLYMTLTPSRRRAWLTFHRRWTTVFYAAIVWHFVSKSLGLVGVFRVLGGALVWRYRKPANERLATLDWPFRRKSRRAGETGALGDRTGTVR